MKAVQGLIIVAIVLALVAGAIYLRFRPTLADADFEFHGLDGLLLGPREGTNTALTAHFFLGTACPISRQYAPEIERICTEFKAKGVDCLLVYPEPDLTEATLESHLKDYGHTSPAVLDANHNLVKKAGATVTPEAAVFSRSGDLIYRGRIDDRYPEPGRPRPEVQTHDLRDALTAATEGRPVRSARADAVGCFIEGP